MDEPTLNDRDRADLARLADGTLPARRRTAMESRVAESPQLRPLLDGQRRALALVRGAGGEAPAALRERLEAARREAAPRRRRLRVALGGALAVGATATALALVLTLPGDVPGGPTVVEAAQLAGKAPQRAAPPAAGDHLRLAVGGVPFPNWEYRFHWHAAGQRTDRVRGRPVTTVYYTWRRWRIAYSIVAGRRVPPPVATGPILRSGTRFLHFKAAGHTVITWVRGGRTCVLAARGVPTSTMVTLAAWKDGGTV